MSGFLQNRLTYLNHWYKHFLETFYLNSEHPMFLYAGNVIDLTHVQDALELDDQMVQAEKYERSIVSIDGNNITIKVAYFGAEMASGEYWDTIEFEIFGHIRWMNADPNKDLPNFYTLSKIFEEDDLTKITDGDIIRLLEKHVGEFMLTADDLEITKNKSR